MTALKGLSRGLGLLTVLGISLVLLVAGAFSVRAAPSAAAEGM